MIELGQLLKERRVVLGMDLEDVERRTKIRKRYLEALESGDWSVLPGEVYARGFVRSYAECVGLDGLELLERYIDEPHVQALANQSRVQVDQPPARRITESARMGSVRMTESIRMSSQAGSQNPNAEVESPVSQKAKVSQTARRKSPQSDGIPYVPASIRGGARPGKPRREKRGSYIGGAVWQGIAVVAAFAVLAGAWWWIQNSHHTAQAPVATDNLPQNTASASNSNAAVGNQAAGVNTAANTTASTSNAAAASAAANHSVSSGTGSATGATAVLTPQPFPAASGVYTVIATTSGPLVMNATAQGGQCWVQVLSDGKSVDPNDFLVPGKTKTWTANQELRIDLGNVPVAVLTVNGQPVTLPNVTHPVWVVIKKQ